MSWDDVGLRYGTDKASNQHGYLDDYELLLQGVHVERLLEIGVAGGRSVHMWHELFPSALIVGLDIVPECRGEQRRDIDIIIAEAHDPAKMAAVSTLYGPFDVVIDDGSHIHREVQIAFEELFSRVRKGGMYFVEDLDGTDPWVKDFCDVWYGTMIPSREKPDTLNPCLMYFRRS